MKMKWQVGLLVVSALLVSIRPIGDRVVSKAATTPASADSTSTSAAGGAAQVSYGLNNPTTDGDGVTTWDCVWFGSYWQEDTNGDGKANKNDAKQPIKWRVLSVNGDDAFLLADKNLDVQRYNDTYTDVTWETCTMRSWLNGYGAVVNKEGRDYSGSGFFNNAFTSAEQSAIWTTNVVNDDNPVYDTEGGNETLDQVYLLSINEVANRAYGFLSDYNTDAKSRMAKNTEYAKGRRAYTNTSAECVGNGIWWLRSPGLNSRNTSCVSSSGNVYRTGRRVYNDFKAVRPALHLNLSSVSSWSYAGTVVSAGGIGKATSSVTGVGNVSAIKLKQKNRMVTVSWKKVPGAAGYQVWYSTSKKWKDKKQQLIRKNKVTVKKLKKKKTYYFRVRAYRLDGEKKVYGAWSKTKKITMRK